jgi:hypothetical protein
MTSCRVKTQPEAFSLRTVPVWVKARGKKLKVNAVLDGASNESFMNEEVAGLLGDGNDVADCRNTGVK